MWQRLVGIVQDPKHPYVHRDFSWLHFNDRVLAEAKNPNNPLLERLKFLGITASNLDEFFMIRMSSLNREVAQLQRHNSSKLSRHLRIQKEILKSVVQFHRKQSNSLNQIVKKLKQHDVQIIRRPKPKTSEIEVAEQLYFSNYIDQISEPKELTKLDARTLENLQLALLFPNNLWLPIPKSLSPTLWIETNKASYSLIFLDDLLRFEIPRLFRLKHSPVLVRIIRDADIAADLEEEDATSLPNAVRSKMRAREFGSPTKLLVSGSNQFFSDSRLSDLFKIHSSKIFRVTHPLMLHGAFQFANELKADPSFSKRALVYPKFKSNLPKHFKRPKGSFEKILEQDYFIHHPYDSFDSYVNLVEEAVNDKNVVSIEQTVYRIDTLSRVTELLKLAAKTKKVRILIEARARFDEINNIRLAEELRSAGVEVHLAFGKLKLHAKIALITRRVDSKTQYFTHLSTGNYNAKTARLYTDMAIFTANQEIGRDARKFFDGATNNKILDDFKTLVVAPVKLHRRLISLIESETQAARQGKPARIFAKVNSLVDENVVKQLYVASQAGVQIDLNVRGACSLIPRIKGLSENIRVISIVDRFLEHSRIYYFQNADVIYLSSADWMPRNFFKRLELAFPILDSRIASYIKEVVIPTYLNDRYKSWELSRAGIWRRKQSREEFSETRAQYVFERLANSNYKNTPLS